MLSKDIFKNTNNFEDDKLANWGSITVWLSFKTFLEVYSLNLITIYVQNYIQLSTVESK